MSKVRINDLARELEVKSRAILDVLTAVGVTEKKTHSSSLEEHEAEKVRVHFRASRDAQVPASKSARPYRGEEEIRTKIDLSNISRPGDVLKAITQK
jgi:translation initiation factor IF-2